MKKVKGLLALVLALMLVFSLAGCGEVKKAEAAVVGMFDCVKAGDLDGFAEYCGKKDFTANLEGAAGEMVASVFKKTEYEIVSSELQEDGSVIVKTKITSIDMKPVVTDWVTDYMQFALVTAFSGQSLSDEEIQQKMAELFEASMEEKGTEKVTKTVDIKVVENADGEWEIEGTTELFSAVSGNLADEMSSATSSLS